MVWLLESGCLPEQLRFLAKKPSPHVLPSEEEEEGVSHQFGGRLIDSRSTVGQSQDIVGDVIPPPLVNVSPLLTLVIDGLQEGKTS